MAYDRVKCIKTDTQGGWTVEASVAYAPQHDSYAPGGRYWAVTLRHDATGFEIVESTEPFKDRPRLTFYGAQIVFPRDIVAKNTPEGGKWIDAMIEVSHASSGFAWQVRADVTAKTDYVVVSPRVSNAQVQALLDFLISGTREVVLSGFLLKEGRAPEKTADVLLGTAGLEDVDARIARVADALERDESPDACTDDY